MTDDICGAEKTGGDGECQLPASRDDGHCHHHTEIEEERARGGRPPKLDDVYAEVMEAAERGLTYEGIARVAGVGLSTLNDWRQEHDAFASELERRRSIGEAKLVDRVVEEKPEFILERSYGYVKTEKHEVESDNTHRMEGDGFVVEFGDAN